jgi:hypothetical protein
VHSRPAPLIAVSLQEWVFLGLSIAFVATSVGLIAGVLTERNLTADEAYLNELQSAIDAHGNLNLTAVAQGQQLSAVGDAVGLQHVLFANTTLSVHPAGGVIVSGVVTMLGATAPANLTLRNSEDPLQRSAVLEAAMPRSWGVNALPAVTGEASDALPAVQVSGGRLHVVAANSTTSTSLTGRADASLATMHAALAALSPLPPPEPRDAFTQSASLTQPKPARGIRTTRCGPASSLWAPSPPAYRAARCPCPFCLRTARPRF